MNKKSVKFIFPRQQIQDRRNVSEGSRRAALLETVWHSKGAHAMWVSCTKDQESSAAKHSIRTKGSHSKRGREKNHPTRLSSQAAVCKVLQRLLFVQKVPPFQCHSNI